MTASLSALRASRGNASQISTPRNVGRDRPPRTGDLFRREWLQVEHVLVRRAADQINHDDRLLPSGRRREPLRLSKVEASSAPPRPSVPILRKFRRDIRSQNANREDRFPWSVSMGVRRYRD